MRKKLGRAQKFTIEKERNISARVFSRAENERCYFLRALPRAPLTFPRKSANVSAALIFGKERCVSRARKNDERAKGLVLGNRVYVITRNFFA